MKGGVLIGVFVAWSECRSVMTYLGQEVSDWLREERMGSEGGKKVCRSRRGGMRSPGGWLLSDWLRVCQHDWTCPVLCVGLSGLLD